MLKEKAGREISKELRRGSSHGMVGDSEVILRPRSSTETLMKQCLYTEDETVPSVAPVSEDVLARVVVSAEKNVADEDEFNPYEDNSGTTLALKQDDFIVIAGDTRHSSEMVINSREMPKIFRIGNFVLTGTGFYADIHEVYIKMVYEIRRYEVDGPMNIHSAANLLSKILYSKRFFPHYCFCSLSGFDNSVPYIYSYDPLGSFRHVTCICNGSGAPMVQPLLDSFIDKKNWNNADSRGISQDDAVKLVVKAFNAAAERDVKTKDTLEIYVLRRDGLMHDIVPLRRD